MAVPAVMIFVLLLCLQETLSFTPFKNRASYLKSHLRHGSSSDDTGPTPRSPKEEIANTLQTAKRASLFVLNSVLLTKILKPDAANAIGTLYEYKDQAMVIQDISLNVEDASKDAAMTRALFIEAAKEIRTYKVKDEKVVVVGFGPDAMESPPNFLPGVSNFMEDGGHTTITFRSTENAEGNIEIFERGNGLQFIKIGAPDIRLSKALEKDAVINYAYGWVDIDTPGGIPYEVVVGYRFRDNVMLTCLRVTDMRKSVDFLTKELGMKLLPFPMARKEGSQYEKEQDKGSIYMGYSENSMGLLLIPMPPPAKKGLAPNSPLVVGSQLNGFTIVVNDSPRGPDSAPLPTAAEELIQESKTKGAATKTILSPDGYPFMLKLYTTFSKEATKSMPPLV